MRIKRDDAYEAAYRLIFGYEHGRIECKREPVVAEIIMHPLESDDEIARRAYCTVRTVRKWRPHAHRYSVAVKTDAGTLRVRLRAPSLAATP